MITTSRLRESPQMAAEEPERAERAPRRYGRGSGGRTETVVVEGVRKED